MFCTFIKCKNVSKHLPQAARPIEWMALISVSLAICQTPAYNVSLTTDTGLVHGLMCLFALTVIYLGLSNS